MEQSSPEQVRIQRMGGEKRSMFARGDLFPAKIWFTTFFASVGFLMPYFNMLLSHMGYRAWQIGILSGFRPFVSMVSGPLLSGMADNLSAHRKVFLTTLAFGAVARASLGVVASPFVYVIFVIVIMEIMNGPVSPLSDTAVMSSARSKSDYGNCRFWASLAFNVSGMISSVAMSVYGDAAVFIGYAVGSAVAFTAAWHLNFDKVHISPAQDSPPQSDLLYSDDKNTDLRTTEACARSPVNDEDRNSLDVSTDDSACVHEAIPDSPIEVHRSSTIRQHIINIPGDVQSFSSAQDLQTQGAGATADASCSTGDVGPGARLMLAGAASTATLCLVRSESDQGDTRYLDEPLLPFDPQADVFQPADSTHEVAEQPCRHDSYGKKLATAMKNPHMTMFLIKGFVMGVGNGVIDGYLFVYLDMLGAPPALLGLCLMMICCAELPVFAYSGPILNFLGYSGALHLALGAFCCRFTVYATLHLMPSFWMVAPFEMLHGITFAIAWAAGVNYCKAMAPEGLKSTIQSLFVSSYSGLGRGLGGLVGGILLNRFGGPALFLYALVWTVCCWALISIAEWLLMRYTPEF